MKILLVSNLYPSRDYPAYGVFVENFCDQLRELGIAYRLCVMTKPTGALEKAWGYGWLYLKSFVLCLFGRWDLVYVHYASHSSPGVLLASRLRHFRIFANVHGSDVMPENPRQEKWQRFTRQLLRRSEKIIVPSPYFAGCVREKYAVPTEKIAVCPSGGVDTRVFSPGARVENSLFTFGFVGRIAPGKGWDTLLLACAAMPDGHYRVLLAGDGPERPALEAMRRQLGLETQVQLLGSVSHKELPDIYRAMDVFLFPTRRTGESLGLVALEAMACGVPVIASDMAAPGEYVRAGVNGATFPPGDADALRDAMVALRALPEEARRALRQGALATARNYSRAAATEQLKAILEGQL